MIFDQKLQPPKDIRYLLDDCKQDLIGLESKQIVNEVDDMIAPETVTNLKQDYILDEPTVLKIDNEQEKKASIVFIPTKTDNKISRETDKIDLQFDFVVQPKEKSHSVKEELHMEPIIQS